MTMSDEMLQNRAAVILAMLSNIECGDSWSIFCGVAVEICRDTANRICTRCCADFLQSTLNEISKATNGKVMGNIVCTAAHDSHGVAQEGHKNAN